MSDSHGGAEGTSQALTTRKVRLHQIMRPLNVDGTSSSSAAASSSNRKGREEEGASPIPRVFIDRRISEILPVLADLPIAGTAPGPSGPLDERTRLRIAKNELAHAEAMELATVFDMSRPNALDNAPAPPGWAQSSRPAVRKVQLSQYQYEMINYQRMLLRKNIWYYRDRMSVPRGPCPLHVLKECWVQGVIDENTLMWGHGLYDWLPAKNVKLLLPMVLTPEVRLGAWIKKTFSLKPSLNRIREVRKEDRDPQLKTLQVERMF